MLPFFQKSKETVVYTKRRVNDALDAASEIRDLLQADLLNRTNRLEQTMDQTWFRLDGVEDELRTLNVGHARLASLIESGQKEIKVRQDEIVSKLEKE